MATRVVNDDLLAILPASFAGKDLTAFIATANLVIQENLTNQSISDGMLKLIEKYLAGHFALISLGEVTVEKIGSAENTYHKGRSGGGFAETALGRQAIALDPTGILSNFASRQATFEVL